MKRSRLVLLVVCIGLGACGQPKPATSDRQAVSVAAPAAPALDPEFLARASIYEVNVRQFSEAGTLAEVTRQIPRLKALGVDILWLMPIQPIGEKKRKGALGSYYSISDYTAVHPDYGTLDDVKALVATAHQHGQLVLLDWVANHTAWDHPWISRHPDWYTRNADGDIIDPIDPNTGKSWGWTDVADLNYDEKALWPAMSDAMAFWLVHTGMDGFRCDVAGEVPTKFWQFARQRLEAVKPVFMLAEAEKTELTRVFDMSYGWQFHQLMNQIARGERTAHAIDAYMQERQREFPATHTLMMFTTNHDENAWNGTVFERYGAAHKSFAVLAFTIDGMPLIYSGQESGLDRRLAFFEHDPIDWKDYPLQDFYRQLLALKDEHEALRHGGEGGRFSAVQFQSNNPLVYAFRRTAGESTVFATMNFSGEPAHLTVTGSGLKEQRIVFGDALVRGNRISLEPFGFAVLAEN